MRPFYLLIGFAWLLPAASSAQSVRVSFPASLRSEPITGRAFVFLSLEKLPAGDY